MVTIGTQRCWSRHLYRTYAINKESRALIASGFSEQELYQLAVKQAKLGGIGNPFANIPEFGSSPEELRASMNDMETRFTIAEERCVNLKEDEFIGTFIKAAGYQKLEGPKSFFGMMIFKADQGDAETMFFLGAYYYNGIKPDPDHKQEFYWYSKSAEAGSAAGASTLAGSYFTGRGTAKDFAEAMKWAVIGRERGDSSDIVETIESAVTLNQSQEGRKRAVAWLQSHRS